MMWSGVVTRGRRHRARGPREEEAARALATGSPKREAERGRSEGWRATSFKAAHYLATRLKKSTYTMYIRAERSIYELIRSL